MQAHNGIKAVLFDLDGTLVDSAPVICTAMQQTLQELGGRVEPLEYFQQFVGPALTYSFAQMGAKPQEIQSYVEHFRKLYYATMLDSPLFPGVAQMLQRLADNGVKLALATAKLEPMAHTMLQHLGIAHYFDFVCGTLTNVGHADKSEIIGRALAQCYQADVLSKVVDTSFSTSSADMQNGGKLGGELPLKWRTDVLMVGDRIYDVQGAQAHRIPTVLVAWGKAPESEQAAAWKVITQAEQLWSLIVSGIDS